MAETMYTECPRLLGFLQIAHPLAHSRHCEKTRSVLHKSCAMARGPGAAGARVEVRAALEIGGRGRTCGLR